MKPMGRANLESRSARHGVDPGGSRWRTGATPREDARVDRSGRRRCLALGAALTLVSSFGLGACAAPGSSAATQGGWSSRLRGSTVALLGEVHDHPGLHRLRMDGLTAACQAGWRPVIVFEQFDVDRQDDLDRARRERPDDARHLIAAAGAPRGWDWSLYSPLIELALQYGLSIDAGNLSRESATRIVKEGYDAVFAPARLEALGLATPAPSDLVAGQQREIEAGHCGALPARLVAPMARAQFARDAVMAERLRRASDAGHGAVLIAGNGHVRRDLGVPRWLPRQLADAALVVGFIEQSSPSAAALALPPFDVVVTAPPVERPDPCRAFAAPSRG